MYVINNTERLIDGLWPSSSPATATGRPAIVFVHIPKAGGSTVYSILRCAYRTPELFKLQTTGPSLKELCRLDKQQRAGLKVIYGHMDMSLSGFLPEDARYITFLRDPIKRLVSFYYYVRYMTNDELHDLAMRLPITEWIEHEGRTEFDNGMVRRLTGTMDSVPFGGCTREMLEQAKTALDRFAFVGLTERFDESYVALCNLFGWKVRYFRPEKKNSQRPILKRVSDPKSVAAITRHNQLDIELYRHAVQIFEKKLSRIDIDTGMEELEYRRNSLLARIPDMALYRAGNGCRRLIKKLRRYRHFG